MLDHTDPVASIIPAMSLDSTSDNAMTALSRLALGPVNTAYYLAVFERFDNTGRTTTTWNWAACLATLNWMLFRQLWTAALVYVAAAEGLALAVFGIGRTFLHWPPGVELGVLGAVAVLAFAVPGLYGNAILYADVRKRVARALAASRTLPEASALLEKQASSRKRLHAIVLGNVVLGVAGLLAYWAWAPSDTPPLALEPAVTVAQATAAAASASTSAPSGSHSAAAPLPKPLPVGELPPQAEPAADAPPSPLPQPSANPPPSAPPQPRADTAPSSAAVSAPAAVVASAPPVASPPATASTAPAASTQPAKPAALTSSSTVASATPTTPTKATRASEPASASTARQSPASTPAPKTNAKAAAKTPTSSAAAPAASSALPAVGTAAGYYINVGLFADEANARKAQAKLLNEGLPAFRQELHGANGRRIRVRVGPYPNRAQADAAAQSIRALALEAVVFKQ